MTNSQNNYHSELNQKIQNLKLEIQLQEDDIKLQFNEIVESIDPVAILKQSIVTLTSDNEIKIDTARLAINLGTNYAIDKLLNKNSSLKSFLLSMIIKRFPNSFFGKMIKQFQ